MLTQLNDASSKAYEIHALCQGLSLLIDGIEHEPSPASNSANALVDVITGMVNQLAIDIDLMESDTRRISIQKGHAG